MLRKKKLAVLILVLLLVAGSAYRVPAATGGQISSVAMKIKSEIEADRSDSNVEITVTSNRYVLEDYYVTNEPAGEWKGGSKPRIKVTLRTSTEDYYFRTGFSKSDVSLSGAEATVTSVSRLNSTTLVVNITLAAIDAGSGGYDLEINELSWDEDRGRAYWGECGDAKYYEVRVYRGTSLLNTSTLTTSNDSYSLAGYLTRSGDYVFRVRAVYNSTYKGPWKESDVWYVDSDTAREMRRISDSQSDGNPGGGPSGSGSSVSGGPTSGYHSGAWLLDKVGWWYCNADRSYTVNNWQYINDRWYYFNGQGYMVTGWVLWKNLYYYCGPNGDMLTSTWTPDGYYVDSAGVWVQGMRR